MSNEALDRIAARDSMVRPPRDRARLVNRIVFVVSVPLLVLVWQGVVSLGLVNRALTPAPSDVWSALLDSVREGSMLSDMAWSASRVLVGYIMGSSLGIAVGLTTARFAVLNSLVSPVLQLLRPIPPIAMVPFVIVWFGLSEAGKYFLVGWGTFFVVWIATSMGVVKVNPLLIRAAQSLGVPEDRMLRDVIFPGALPYIVVGLRTAVTIAFYTLVAAEVAGAFGGLAYRIDAAHQNMQTGLMMASLVMLGLMSAATDYGFNALAKRIVFWH